MKQNAIHEAASGKAFSTMEQFGVDPDDPDDRTSDDCAACISIIAFAAQRQVEFLVGDGVPQDRAMQIAGVATTAVMNGIAKLIKDTTAESN